MGARRTMNFERVGNADSTEMACVQEILCLAQPALDYAQRRSPTDGPVSLRLWSSPLALDVLHEGGRVARVVVTNRRMAELFATFLTAGLNKLPVRERLKIKTLIRKLGMVMAAEFDVTFGGVAAVAISHDEQRRVELFRLSEGVH